MNLNSMKQKKQDLDTVAKIVDAMKKLVECQALGRCELDKADIDF